MFGNLITEMVARNLSERDLAHLLGCGVPVVQKKLCGVTPFTLGEIELLMKLFPNRPFESLFHEDQGDLA
ncbi:MAG TPA: hypothetical protein DCR44_00945 [Acholeplasmatales bacterium]|nr:hypothetical protein [Acholeplasmatales bacterium]